MTMNCLPAHQLEAHLYLHNSHWKYAHHVLTANHTMTIRMHASTPQHTSPVLAHFTLEACCVLPPDHSITMRMHARTLNTPHLYLHTSNWKSVHHVLTTDHTMTIRMHANTLNRPHLYLHTSHWKYASLRCFFSRHCFRHSRCTYLLQDRHIHSREQP
jgi:hypothetical protein